jgi:hypothetical protein
MSESGEDGPLTLESFFPGGSEEAGAQELHRRAALDPSVAALSKSDASRSILADQ